MKHLKLTPRRFSMKLKTGCTCRRQYWIGLFRDECATSDCHKQLRNLRDEEAFTSFGTFDCCRNCSRHRAHRLELVSHYLSIWKEPLLPCRHWPDASQLCRGSRRLVSVRQGNTGGLVQFAV